MMMTELYNESEKALLDFAELYIEALKDEKEVESLESLEQYIHAMKMRLYADKINFQHNFLKGYRVLVEELKRKKN